MKLIEELKQVICQESPFAEAATRAAIAMWEDDQAAITPRDERIFAVCDHIKATLAAWETQKEGQA